MVLMPVKTAPGSLRAPRGRGINKSMKPRVQQLCAAIDSGHAPAQKQAVSELALLVACSANARGAIADPAVEGRLVQLLSATDDPTMLSWTISVLSNLGRDLSSRERQAAAVPRLCQLLEAESAEVQHAAALHIATLSHAPSLQKAIGQAGGFGSLSKLESMSSLAMASPAQRQLQRDAADYARWTLRTSHGRNYKPAFRPKSPATLRREAAATKAQAHARRRAGNERVQAARASKVPAATAVQSAYRGKVGRAEAAARRPNPVLFSVVEGDPSAGGEFVVGLSGGSGDDDVAVDVAALYDRLRDGKMLSPDEMEVVRVHQRLLDGKLLTADEMDILRGTAGARLDVAAIHDRLREGKMLTAAEMEVLREAQQQGVPDVEELQQRLLEGKMLSKTEMEVLRASPELRGTSASPDVTELHQRLADGKILTAEEMEVLRSSPELRGATGGGGAESPSWAFDSAGYASSLTLPIVCADGRTYPLTLGLLPRRGADDYTTMASRVIETAISRALAADAEKYL